MGSSPKIPSVSLPNAPSLQKIQGMDVQQLQNVYQNQTASPGSTNVAQAWNSSGLAGLPADIGINSPMGQTVAGNIANYAMSDADFAARYPQMVQAQQKYQGYLTNLLGTQTPTSMAAGNTLSNAGSAVLPSASQAIGTGQGIANQAQNFLTPAANLASGAQAAGQPDISLGQDLINGNRPMDPMVQQEMMRAGLGSAAGSLGGAMALGGTAGQAAVGRQLGVGAQNWINQQRTMGQQLQQTGIGLTTGMAGAAGTLAGAGTGVAGAGANLMNAGSGILGAGTSAMTGGQNIINSATQNANQTMGLASSMFQPRQFGPQGSDLGNMTIANVTAQNNLNQLLYASQLQNNQTNAQIAGANAGAAAQSAGNLISGGTSAAASAVSIGVAIAISCWVAKECFGDLDPRFQRFRYWMLNLAPAMIRKFYLKHGQSFASFIHSRPFIKVFVRDILSLVSDNVVYAPVSG